MKTPRYLVAEGYCLPDDRRFFDDPALTGEQDQLARNLAFALAGEALGKTLRWITNEGKASPRQVALKVDLMLLSINPVLLDCESQSAVAAKHLVSRAYASKVRKDLISQLAPHVRFRGQRFRKANPRRKQLASTSRRKRGFQYPVESKTPK